MHSKLMLSTSVCCMPEIIFYAKKFATEPNKQCDVNSKSKDCCLLIRFWGAKLNSWPKISTLSNPSGLRDWNLCSAMAQKKKPD